MSHYWRNASQIAQRTFKSTTNASSSTFAQSTGSAFSSNAHILHQQAAAQNAGGAIATFVNVGASSGGGANSGWHGGKSNFNGYSGFGRIITQAPSNSAAVSLTSNGTTEEEERKQLALRRLRERRFSESRPAPPPQTLRIGRDETSPRFKIVDLREGRLLMDKEEVVVEAEEMDEADVEIKLEEGRRHRLRMIQQAQGQLPASAWTPGIRPTRIRSDAPRQRTRLAVAGSGWVRSAEADQVVLVSGTRSMHSMRPRSKSTSAIEGRPEISDEEAAVLMARTRESLSTPPSPALDEATVALRAHLEDLDKLAYRDLHYALTKGNKETFEELAHRYRNPPSIVTPVLSATSEAVTPPYFTQQVYNLILLGQNHFREAGQPISAILATYNEMLERDILPNAKTYTQVLVALLSRDAEIRGAVSNSDKSRKWLLWDAERGSYAPGVAEARLTEMDSHKSQLAELAKENNFATAMKLFLTAMPYNRHRPFGSEAYEALMESAAARGDVDSAVKIWAHIESCVRDEQNDFKIGFTIFENLIKAYGAAEQIDAVPEVLTAFAIYEKKGAVLGGRVKDPRRIPLEEYPEGSENERFTKARAARVVYHAALSAYAANHDMDKVTDLFKKMKASPIANVVIPGTVPPISRRTYSRLAKDLFLGGHIQLGKDMVEDYYKVATKNPSTNGSGFRFTGEFVDAAILSGRPDAVLASIKHLESNPPSMDGLRTRLIRVLQVLLPAVGSIQTSEQGKEFLASVVTLLRATGEERPTEDLVGFASPLAELAEKFEEPEARAFIIKWFYPATSEIAATESVADASLDSSASVSGSAPESTVATSVEPESPKATIDLILTDKIRMSIGAKPKISHEEAVVTLRAAYANGHLAAPFFVAVLGQEISRNPGQEPLVRELYDIAMSSIPACEVERQHEAWVAVQNQMLMSCCHMGLLEEAGMYRAQLIEAGAAPSADAYATMIASAKDTTDDASVARELFEESEKLGVRPTLFLYNTIISKLSRARKAEPAIELFMRMKAEKVRPSSVTYGAVINACCRVGDAESATNLFAEMQKMPNFKPRVPPYNTMMQLHLQTHPSRDHVLHYYNQLVQARVPPSAHTYKLLLDAYGTLQPIDLDAMQKVFDNLCSDRSVPVQGTHWASLIYAHGRVNGDMAKAIEIFESIPSHPSTRPGAILEPVCWEAILNVLALHKAGDKIDEYAARMRSQGSKVTAYVNNMLIKGYATAGEMDKARDVFEGMADSLTGVAAPNNHPTLLTSSGQAKPTTTAPTDLVFREPSTYEAMIRAELAVGNKDAALALCERLEARMYPAAVTSRIRAIVDEAGSL